MNNAQEALIGWEDSRPTSQGVSLHETLTHVLAQHLNHTTTARVGELIPLEVAVGIFEDGVQFITFQLIRREQSHGVRVFHEDSIDQLAIDLHCTFICAFLRTELLPVRQFRCDIAVVGFNALAQLLRVFCWNNRLDLVDYIAVFCKKFFGLIAGEPILQKTQLLLITLGLGQGDLVGME